MRFNLLLADESTDRLQELDDAIRPVLFGLRAAGHAVGVSCRGLKPAPAINLAVDALVATELVEAVRSARASPAGGVLFGVLCTAPLEALAAPRRDLVRAALAVSDFVWEAEGVVVPPDLADPGRVASLSYGFNESLLGSRLIADPALRDTDVVIYARESARTNALAARLGAVGLSQFMVQPGALPDYLACDLLSRGKVAVVLGDGSSSALASRVMKAICNGVAAVTEPGVAAVGRFGGGVIELPDDAMPERCVAIIRGGRYVELGRAALDALRTGPSMADGVRAALGLPAFLPAGGG